MCPASSLSVRNSKFDYSLLLNDLEVIDEQVMQEEQKLLRLNFTIAELQDNLREMKVDQNTLKRRIKNYRGIISPFRKLPPETLQAIFIRCLPPMRNATMSSKEAPLLLGRICHRWRKISYATPQLWSSIHIVISLDVLPWYQRPRPPSLEDISSWLHRSGALPLSISIYFPRKSPSNPSITQSYLDTLVKFKSRWGSLDLFSPSYDWIGTLGQLNAIDLPLVERLYISGRMQSPDNPHGYDAAQNLSTLTRDDSILQAPSLHSLGMPLYGLDLSQLALHWEHLTNLAILGESMSGLGRTLPLCRNLVTCTLHFRFREESPEESMNFNMINLPNLRLISFIEGCAHQPTSYFLKHLHAPQLRHLSYEHEYAWDTPSLLGALAAFLPELIAPLEELQLILQDTTKVDVVGILRLTHGLKRLALRHKPRFTHSWFPPGDTRALKDYFRDDHLLSLTPSELQVEEEGQVGGGHGNLGDSLQALDDAPSLTYACPNLEVFQCVGAKFSGAVLLNFLRSRCTPKNMKDSGGFAPLRAISIVVTLLGDGQESESIREEIKQLQAANPFMPFDVTFASLNDDTPPCPWQVTVPFSPSNGLEMFLSGWWDCE